jgi:hypothetical protein
VRTALVLIVSACVLVQIHPLAQVSRASRGAAQTYESATVDPAGNLRIVTADHKTIVVPKSRTRKRGDEFGNQTEFSTPVISEDRRAVGAQAMFKNCCTSYDIPLQVVVYSQGKAHRFEGGLAIFDWHFSDGGRRIVFSQQTVHFGCAVHWELREVASEALLAQVDIPEACGQTPDPPKVDVPGWVTGAVSGFK